MNKRENAITLVIILIIIAGVSINLTLGNNGIITMAKKAKENIEIAKVEEEIRLNELYTQLELESGSLGDIPYETKEISIVDAIENTNRKETIYNGEENECSVQYTFKEKGNYKIFVTETETGNCFGTTTLSTSGIVAEKMYEGELKEYGSGTTYSRARNTILNIKAEEGEQITITTKGSIAGAQSYGTTNQISLLCLILK